MIESIHCLKRLRAFSRRRIAAIVVLALVSLGIELTTVAFIPPIIGAIVGNSFGSAPTGATKTVMEFVPRMLSFIGLTPTITTMLALFSVILLVRQIAAFAETFLVERSAMWSYRRITETLFGAWMAAPSAAATRIGTGTFVTMFVRHCNIASQIVPAYAKLFRALLTVAVYVSLAVWINPVLVVLTATYGLLVYLPIRYTIQMAKASSKRGVQSQNMCSDFLSDCAGGWRQIQIFDLSERMRSKLGAFVDEVNAASRSQTIASNAAPLVLIVGLIGLIALINLFMPFIGDITTAVGVLLGVFALRVLPMLQALTSRTSAIAVSKQSLEYIIDMFNRFSAKPTVTRRGKSLSPIARGIRFDHVTFAYDSRQAPVLENVSLLLPAGKVIAIRGASGSGKSTFLDLIAGFIRPTSGRMFYDATDQAEVSGRMIMSQVALATQEPFIFQGNILENIKAADTSVDRLDVEQAAKAAGIHDVVAALPKGYDTIVGQAGEVLSGGQKQRLALARMFLSKASVLMFDEPTSSLDHELELGVITAIKSHVEAHGKTALIVTHREGVWRNADMTIEFVDGSPVITSSAKPRLTGS